MRPDLHALLRETLTDAHPAEVLCWSGAGISVDAPTRLPTGWELSERVFREFFAPGALDVVLGHHAALGLQTRSPCRDGLKVRLARLETVLGIAVRVYGIDRTMQVLDDFRGARANYLHHFFAGHLVKGGLHITGNFDTCIESALPPGLEHLGANVLHFHGSFASDSRGADLGATLAAIERGFTPEMAEGLRKKVSSASLLLLFGYSGSDFFDVDQAMAGFDSGELSGQPVVWCMHDLGERCPPRAIRETDPPMARLLERAGATVMIACAPTAEICRELADHWSLDIPVVDLTAKSARSQALLVSNDERLAATLELYRELRLHRQVRRLLLTEPLPAISPELRWRTQADLLWEEGRFATALRHWARGGPNIPRWERAERIGACLWEQGRLVPAWLWLRFSEHYLHPDQNAKRQFAETSGRVVLRMLRLSDLRWLGRRLAPRALRAVGVVDQHVGLHLYRRLGDVERQLLHAVDHSATVEDDSPVSGEWFREAGDITAILAYRHSHYRRSYEATVPTEELVARYRTLHLDKDLVGTSGIRTMQLPGAHRVYALGEFTRGLLALEYGWWHRFRLLAAFMSRKLRSQ